MTFSIKSKSKIPFHENMRQCSLIYISPFYISNTYLYGNPSQIEHVNAYT